MEKPDNIITIGKAKFEQIRRSYCHHEHFHIDYQNQTVQCKDCKQYISPFRALEIILGQWKDSYALLDRRHREIEELERRHNVGLLKATRLVDKAWRRKKYIPCCPHCNEAIFPGDGFGNHMTNKSQAIQRRKFLFKEKANP